MKIGLNLNTFAATDNLESILKLTKDFGLNQVEFWSTNCESSPESVSDFAYKGKNTEQAKKLIARFGVKVCCLTYGAGLDPQFIKNRKLFSQEFVRAVELAAEFGGVLKQTSRCG